jgi:hypothetical protein
MANSVYQFIINDFSVGTWLQTLVFYAILSTMLHIILVQMDLSVFKWGSNILQRRSSLD